MRRSLGLLLAGVALIVLYRASHRTPPLLDPGPTGSLEARLSYIAARRRAAVRKPVKRIWQINLGRGDQRTSAFQWSWTIMNPGWQHEVRLHGLR